MRAASLTLVGVLALASLASVSWAAAPAPTIKTAAVPANASRSEGLVVVLHLATDGPQRITVFSRSAALAWAAMPLAANGTTGETTIFTDARMSMVHLSQDLPAHLRMHDAALEAHFAKVEKAVMVVVAPDAVAQPHLLVIADGKGHVDIYALDPILERRVETVQAESSGARPGPRRERTMSSAAGLLPAAALAPLLVLIALALAGGVGIVLFTRFHRDDVLDHPRRSQLFEAVQTEPGVSFGELCQRFGLVAGVAQHHLGLLVQHGLIARVRDGRFTRFHARGRRVVLPPVGSGAKIMVALEDGAPRTATELAARLGQRVQTTWEQLQRLAASGHLERVVQGRRVGWRRAGA